MDLAISAYFSVLLEERDRLEAEAPRRPNSSRPPPSPALGVALSRLAAGDLSVRIEGALSPEFERLKTDFDNAAASHWTRR